MKVTYSIDYLLTRLLITKDDDREFGDVVFRRDCIKRINGIYDPILLRS